MNKERLSLAVALLIALCAGVGSIGCYDFWQAEASHVLISRTPLSALAGTLQEQGGRPPLYYLLLKAWSAISAHPLNLRILSLLFTLGAVWMVFRLASLLFCWRTGFVSAALCAASPLWCAWAGVTAAPFALDLLLCAALLHTFCRLLVAPSWKRAVVHGLVLAAGLYTQPFFLVSAAMEGVFLAIHPSQFRGLRAKWFSGVLIAITLFLPWVPMTPGQLDQRAGPIATLSEGLGMRMGTFMTQLSLGRPYSWYPPTPVISVTPSPGKDPGPAEPYPGTDGDDPLPGAIQAFQMIFLAWYFIFALVGALAALKVSAWPLPKYLRQRQHALNALNQLRAAQGLKQKIDVSCAAQIVPRQSALLLVLCFLGTFIFAVLGDAFFGWPFIGMELIYLSVPFYILVARGIGTLEWRVMFYGAITVILMLSLLFGKVSRTEAELTDGVSDAAAFLETQIQGGGVGERLGDAVVQVNPCTVMPLKCYTPSFNVPEVVLGAPFEDPGTIPPHTRFCDPDALDAFDWIWWVRPAVPEGSPLSGCAEYLASLYSKRAGHDEPVPEEPPAPWKLEEEHAFGNIEVMLFIRRETR